MKDHGPSLESLTRRLAECPADFLAEPRIGAAGQVPVAPVVSDVLRDLGGPPLTASHAAVFQSSDARQDRNYLRLVLITCWLLHDPWFRQPQQFAGSALDLLMGTVAELARTMPADKFVADPDRREELARVCLKALGLRPFGETLAQAQDRLATLNTAERQRVILAARQAEARARAVREEMARAKAAAEADAKMTRE